MKKLLLLSAGLTVALGLQAQQRPAKLTPLSNPAVQNQAAKMQKDFKLDNELPLKKTSVASPYLNKTSSVVTETILGQTEYDLQTNRSTANRLSNNGDGTISAVWTGSADRNGYPDRGTWYSYWDGTSWTPSGGRIETARAGFTNICMVNGVEYTMTHNGSSQGVLNYRNKGTGAWTELTPVGGTPPSGYTDVWWRMAVGGSGNTIHALVNSQGTQTTPVAGQSGPLTYSRSQDGGMTWDLQHVILPEINSTQYYGFSAEDYHMDAHGNTVAIAIGGVSSDVILLKSTDNGTTWTKTIVMAYPYPAYVNGDQVTMISDVDGDGVADTLDTNSGDVTVTLDNNDMAHIAFGAMRTLDDDPAAEASYFPGTDGLMYWNENMSAPVLVAGAEDLNGDGVVSIPSNASWAFGLYNSGLTCMPSIGFDANNNIFLAYSTICELTDTLAFQQILRHVYFISSTDGGATWTAPYDVVPMAAQGGDGEFQEAVFASIAKKVDANVHILYQRDPAPGHSLSSDATQAANNTSPNDIVYVNTPAVTGIPSVNATSFSMTQNYPNPFSGSTSFELNLKKNSAVTLEVYNILGKLVKTATFDSMPAGTNLMTIDASNLASGIYTYTVIVGADKLTNKMIVK